MSLVIFGGENYSLQEKPDTNSKLVKEAQTTLLTMLRIDDLATDLATVGKFVFMAYCGLLGQKKLEVEMFTRLRSVVDLCDDSAFTLNEFTRSADHAITDMIAAYGFLSEGFEDIAIETLQGVATYAINMQDASEKLQIRFKEEKEKLVAVHNDTMVRHQEVKGANIQTEKDIKSNEEEKLSTKAEKLKADKEEAEYSMMVNRLMDAEQQAVEAKRQTANELDAKLKDVQKNMTLSHTQKQLVLGKGSKKALFISLVVKQKLK